MHVSSMSALDTACTLKHTQAVSSADRVQCLALLKYRQLIQQSTARAKFRNNSLKNTQTKYKNKQKIMNTQT